MTIFKPRIMTKCNLTLTVPISINIDDLDGITLVDISRHIGYYLRKEDTNHPPFEIQMFSRSIHHTLNEAIREAIEELHAKKYPGTVPYETENSRGETAKWLLTSKKIVRRIQYYFTDTWKATLEKINA
jgi:hypothetical protein